MPRYTVTLWVEAHTSREIEAESPAEAERLVTDDVYEELRQARMFTASHFTSGKVEEVEGDN